MKLRLWVKVALTLLALLVMWLVGPILLVPVVFAIILSLSIGVCFLLAAGMLRIADIARQIVDGE